MAMLDGHTAEEIADMLRFAAMHGASSGALSMLDEAALAFRRHPDVTTALQEFSARRYAYQRFGDTAWPAAATAALSLADALRPAGTERVPEGWNT